jgi:hypothetical protein
MVQVQGACVGRGDLLREDQGPALLLPVQRQPQRAAGQLPALSSHKGLLFATCQLGEFNYLGGNHSAILLGVIICFMNPHYHQPVGASLCPGQPLLLGG